jgi:hypothetical protein
MGAWLMVSIFAAGAPARRDVAWLCRGYTESIIEYAVGLDPSLLFVLGGQ